MSDPALVGLFDSKTVQFTAEGQLARVLLAPYLLQAARGLRISAIRGINTDSGNTYNLTLWKGRIRTANNKTHPFSPPDDIGLTPVLATTKGSPDVVGRTNGSFLQDGWAEGMHAALLFDSANPLNDHIDLVSSGTAPTATVLTLANNNLLNANDTCGPNTILVQVSPWQVATLAESAGFSPSVPPQALLSFTTDPSVFPQPDQFALLGANEILIASVATAPASGTHVDIQIEFGLY